MKTNCSFNRKSSWRPGVAGVLIPLLLGCFAAVFISASTPAVASETVPFNGTVSGFVESQEPVDGCTVHVHVINFGNATELGAFTGYADFYPNFCEDYPNITYTGTFHWVAANGDKLEGTFEGYLTPTATLGVYDNHETADVTGSSSTGRFFGAAGHFTLGGQLDFNTGSFVLPWQGIISSVGATKKL